MPLAPAYTPRQQIRTRAHGGFLDGSGLVGVVGLPKSGTNYLLALLSEAMGLNTCNYKEQGPFDGLWLTSFHNPFEDFAYRQDLLRAVYILRDPRDIIVSYYHYARTPFYRERVDPGCDFADITQFYTEFFLSKVLYVYGFMTHAEEYALHNVPVIRFENLRADAEGELQRLFRRWGCSPPGDIAAAVENCRIERMRENQPELGGTRLPSSHYRSGESGGWRKELPETVLRDVRVRFADYLRRWGYDPE